MRGKPVSFPFTCGVYCEQPEPQQAAERDIHRVHADADPLGDPARVGLKFGSTAQSQELPVRGIGGDGHGFGGPVAELVLALGGAWIRSVFGGDVGGCFFRR